MKINIQILSDNFKMPRKATKLSGGYDVFASKIEKINEDLVIVYLGFAAQPENENFKITLVPRSSITKTKWLVQNSPGLGDPDYTGEYQFRFRALPIRTKQDINNHWSHELTYPDFPYSVGDAVGQIYLEEIIPIEFNEVLLLNESQRGTGGFGSTDKK